MEIPRITARQFIPSQPLPQGNVLTTPGHEPQGSVPSHIVNSGVSSSNISGLRHPEPEEYQVIDSQAPDDGWPMPALATTTITRLKP